MVAENLLAGEWVIVLLWWAAGLLFMTRMDSPDYSPGARTSDPPPAVYPWPSPAVSWRALRYSETMISVSSSTEVSAAALS